MPSRRWVAGLGMTSALAGVNADGGCDLDDLAAKINPATRAVIVCSPNAPTGGIVSRERFERFLAHVPATVLTILDEAYGEPVRISTSSITGTLECA